MVRYYLTPWQRGVHMRLIITGAVSFGIMYGVPLVGYYIQSTLSGLPLTAATEGVAVAVIKGLGAILIWTMLYNALKIRKRL